MKLFVPILLFSLLFSSKSIAGSPDLVKLHRSIGEVVLPGPSGNYEDRANGSIFAISKNEFLTAGHVCLALQFQAEANPELKPYILYIDQSGILRRLSATISALKINVPDDICLMTMNQDHGLEPIKIQSNIDLKRGSDIWSLGAQGSLFPIVKHGYVSGHTNSHVYPFWESFTVLALKCLPGSSGSLVVNNQGKLIGMVVAVGGTATQDEFSEMTLLAPLSKITTFLNESK